MSATIIKNTNDLNKMESRNLRTWKRLQEKRKKRANHKRKDLGENPFAKAFSVKK